MVGQRLASGYEASELGPDVKGTPHYIAVDLREGWMLAGLIRLERYLAKWAELARLYPESGHPIRSSE